MMQKIDLVVIIIALIKHHNKRNLGRKGFIWHCSSQKKSEQEFKQGRNLKAGADAETMRGVIYWLDHYGLLSMLSYRIQN